MGKVIYVNGGILVNTPYFKYVEAGAYFENPPNGAIILEPNKIDANGYKYLEISDEYPQSIFDEYYAKFEFASYYKGVEFLYKNFQEAYDDYAKRIELIKEVVDVEGFTKNQRMIINRLAFINIIASLETFICDTILTCITNSERAFDSYCELIPPNQMRFRVEEMRRQNFMGILEQRVFEYVMKQSYSNIETVNNVYKKIFNFSISDIKNKIDVYINDRHKLTHRNGRNKDGSYIIIENKKLYQLIADAESFVNEIMNRINVSHLDRV